MFGFTFLMPIACNYNKNFTVSADTIQLMSVTELENDDTVSNNTALCDMPYYCTITLPNARFYRPNTQTGRTRDCIVLGLYSEMGFDSELQDFTNFIDTSYIDIYTTRVTNENSYTNLLQRRSISRSSGVYNASSIDLNDWYIGCDTAVNNQSYAPLYNIKVEYMSFQFANGSLHNFETDFDENYRYKYVKHYIYRPSNGYLMNAYEFYYEIDGVKTKGATLYLGLTANGYDGPVYSYESWNDTIYQTTVSSAFNTFFLDILNAGYDVGYEAGYDVGYDKGYDIGFEEGIIYNENQNLNDGSRPIILSIVRGMSDFFNIDILPDVKVGTVLLIALGASVFGLLLKLLIGG